MVKKALIFSACLIIITIIVCIIISIVNMNKTVDFKSVVSYDSNINVITTAPTYEASSNDDDLAFLTNLLKYEKTIMISSLFFVLLFAFLFHGTKRSKS